MINDEQVINLNHIWFKPYMNGYPYGSCITHSTEHITLCTVYNVYNTMTQVVRVL